MKRIQIDRPGFTLIELIVVLIIIATIAGLAIPMVANMGRTSDMAASSNSQSELNSNLQYFFVLQKRYPQGLDSLIDTAGAVYGSDTSDASTQTEGLPYAGSDGTRLEAQLSLGTFDNTDDTTGSGAGGSFRSLSRSGFDYVYSHDRAVANSNNSGTTKVTLASGAKLAEVTGAALIAKLVPNGLLTGQRLVAFGIGPKNSAIGKTISNCPIYPGCDGRYYGRFIAVFMVYANGERATLVAVIDSYGRTPDYTIQQFNESLPDGGRQG